MADKVNFKIAGSLYFLIIYGIIQAYVILNGNLAEDAYILYQYVDNFIAGHGITYNIGQEPVEGATDFLWLMLLSIIAFLGVPTPIAAGILNTIGFGIIGGALGHQLDKTPQPQERLSWKPLIMMSLGIIALSDAAYAAYSGFSTALYMGLITLLISLSLSRSKMSYKWLPIVAIVLGLFRPDGVILGVVFTVIKLIDTYRHNQFKIIIPGTLIALVIGICYFTWRTWYFGHILPLPLYVKSTSSESLPGFYINVNWIKQHIVWISVAICAVGLHKNFWNIKILIPASLLFFMLFFSTQTQNIGFRFQAPLFISLVFYIVYTYRLHVHHFHFPQLMWTGICFFHLLSIYDETPRLFKTRLLAQNYVPAFARSIDEFVTPDTKLLLTEAGRMAYWNNAYIIDLVGLNTPELAKEPVTVDFIADQNPDMLFIYHFGKIEVPEQSLDSSEDQSIIKLSSEEFLNAIQEDKLNSKNYVFAGREKLAASKAIQFLKANVKEFDIYSINTVEYDKHLHIFAIRKTFVYKNEIATRLYDSQGMPSDYFTVKNMFND